MQNEMPNITLGNTNKPAQLDTINEALGEDPIWQALANCQISMPLSKLLNLVAAMSSEKEWSSVPIHLAETSNGAAVIDAQSPTVKLLFKGPEIRGCIIDGHGSGVNVISATTGDQLGITQWEAYPFNLRMADTRSVRPPGLIWHL